MARDGVLKNNPEERGIALASKATFVSLRTNGFGLRDQLP